MPLTPVEVEDLTIRELPPDEWGRLSVVPGPFAGQDLPSTLDAYVLAAEDDSAIVAYWVVSKMVHLDPVWIAPGYRNRSRFLLAWIGALLSLLQREGIERAFALINDPESGALAEKIGLQPIPTQLYAGTLTAPEE